VALIECVRSQAHDLFFYQRSSSLIIYHRIMKKSMLTKFSIKSEKATLSRVAFIRWPSAIVVVVGKWPTYQRL
ncbi:MAG: hypothetical protein AAB687_02360, partial [Patescibacteria group bacterium]